MPNGKPYLGALSQASADTGVARVWRYDALGRLTEVDTQVGTEHFRLQRGYDELGRLRQVVYPTGFGYTHHYDSRGYLTEIRDLQHPALRYWQALHYDAQGRVPHAVLGNGLHRQRRYNAQTDDLEWIGTGPDGTATVQNDSYQYDALGNLQLRSEGVTGLVETFRYDGANRLIEAKTHNGPSTTARYDELGNLVYKSDVGIYIYGQGTRPHAVASIQGTVNATFSYDDNGNELRSNGRTTSWTSFNLPTSIQQGSYTDSYVYDLDHVRLKHITPQGSVIQLNPRLDLGAHYEKDLRHGKVVHTSHVYAGNEAIAAVVEQDGQRDIRYLHTDHLGSITAVSNAQGKLTERLSYDAWGKRRNPDGSLNPGLSGQQTHHGFTGHEHLDEVGLIQLLRLILCHRQIQSRVG
ncbi:RHS repeat protein [Chitinivorax sp. B]|uniref:RHS repeat protein n=1 Tax=Chitinivorax sp. B TaxID=2502235 RepID=UPI001484FF03|nr:RHS repeat protein [Chitinivorax sp. B]